MQHNNALSSMKDLLNIGPQLGKDNYALSQTISTMYV